MDNWCVFCGKPIEDGQLTCSACVSIVEDLTIEQRREFERILKDEHDRAAFIAAVGKVKENAAKLIDVIYNAVEAIAEYLAERGQYNVH